MSIVFFDFDETVITGKSMFIFIKKYSELYKLKCRLSFYEIIEKVQEMNNSGKKRECVNCYYYSLFRGEEQYKVRAVAKMLFDDGYYTFNIETIRRIRFHQSQGDTCVFISGAMVDIIYPVMDALGVKESLCSEPLLEGGYYTGEIKIISVGYHKAEHARNYAKKYNQPLAECYAYGDHISDLDLLQLVGHPCAVNPSSELMFEAQRQGWPILISQNSDSL